MYLWDDIYVSLGPHRLQKHDVRRVRGSPAYKPKKIAGSFNALPKGFICLTALNMQYKVATKCIK